MANTPLKHVSGTAPDGVDGSEESWSFPCNWLSYIVNDNDSGSLFVAFDGDPFGQDAVEIPAGDKVTDLPLGKDGVSMMRVRSEDGNTVAFRALGVYRHELEHLLEARRASEAGLGAVAELRARVSGLEEKARRILDRMGSIIEG